MLDPLGSTGSSNAAGPSLQPLVCWLTTTKPCVQQPVLPFACCLVYIYFLLHSPKTVRQLIKMSKTLLGKSASCRGENTLRTSLVLCCNLGFECVLALTLSFLVVKGEKNEQKGRTIPVFKRDFFFPLVLDSKRNFWKLWWTGRGSTW